MDRFNTNEDISYIDNHQYIEGMNAHKNGLSIKNNPYPFEKSGKTKSKFALWNTGWCDQDMIELQINKKENSNADS